MLTFWKLVYVVGYGLGFLLVLLGLLGGFDSEYQIVGDGLGGGEYWGMPSSLGLQHIGVVGVCRGRIHPSCYTWCRASLLKDFKLAMWIGGSSLMFLVQSLLYCFLSSSFALLKSQVPHSWIIDGLWRHDNQAFSAGLTSSWCQSGLYADQFYVDVWFYSFKIEFI